MFQDINSIKEDSKKTILLYIFPGIIFIWPHIIGLLKFSKNNTLLNKWHFEHIEIFYYFIIVILIYGFGHLMNKLGLRLEVCLEKRIFSGEKYDEFYNNFETYLKTSFDKNREPVIIRYYSSFITSFKLETTLFCSIISMLISIFLWNFYLNIFDCKIFLILTSTCILLLLYLYFEIKEAIKGANELRLTIIKVFNELQLNNEQPST